jgi:DNA-binding response OmpR family regulator
MKTEKKSSSEDNEELDLLLKVPFYKIGAYTVDVQKRLLTTLGESKKLTIKELSLLVLLASNANKLLDRKNALKIVWKDDNYYNARSMDVYICKLRKLLVADPDVIIINIHGKGYKLIIPA